MKRKEHLTDVKMHVPVICGLFNQGNLIEAILIDCRLEGMSIICQVPFKEKSTLIIRIKDGTVDTKFARLLESLRSLTLAKVTSCEPIVFDGDDLYKIEAKYKYYR